MNTCKTCKWWSWDEKSSKQFPYPSIQFKCRGTHVKDNDIAGMVDAEDYGGVFTGPDFGCIYYEETQEELHPDHPGFKVLKEKVS